MKAKCHLGFILLFLISLSGCGTHDSLIKKENYVQYATVNVSPVIKVSGRLLNITDSLIAISVDGANVEYNHNDIIDYTTYMAPNPNFMQADIVKNSRATASNTGFFVGMVVIGIMVGAILMLAP